MLPYGADLRRRVVAAYQRGDGSIRDLAAEFEIAPRTLQNWLALVGATGTILPRAHGGGRPAQLTPARLQILRQLVREDADATLAQLAARLAAATGCVVHPATISRALADLDLTRKKRRSTRRSAIGRTSGGSGGRFGGGSRVSRGID